MKFTVEVEDFWLEEEDLSSALKRHVIHEVVTSIHNSIKQKIEDHVTKEVKAQVEQSLYRKISSLVGEIIATDKIKGRYSNDPDMTLREWVNAEFRNNSRYETIQEHIKKLANTFGDDMKKRFDLLYASQIVAKMGANGLLKEDAVKLLLTEPEPAKKS
jgi:hypothetical protein